MNLVLLTICTPLLITSVARGQVQGAQVALLKVSREGSAYRVSSPVIQHIEKAAGDRNAESVVTNSIALKKKLRQEARERRRLIRRNGGNSPKYR